MRLEVKIELELAHWTGLTISNRYMAGSSPTLISSRSELVLVISGISEGAAMMLTARLPAPYLPILFIQQPQPRTAASKSFALTVVTEKSE
jgi:hypothetical protein